MGEKPVLEITSVFCITSTVHERYVHKNELNQKIKRKEEKK